MKSKIERSEIDVLEDILQEVQDNNEFIQELLADGDSQSQPEERTQSAPMPDISSLPRRNGEYRYPEDYVGDPIEETTTSSTKDTPEEKTVKERMKEMETPYMETAKLEEWNKNERRKRDKLAMDMLDNAYKLHYVKDTPEDYEEPEEVKCHCGRCGKGIDSMNLQGEWACEKCEVEDTPEEWVCSECGSDDCYPFRNSEDFELMYCPMCDKLVNLN